jgi:hypothetical protein
MEEREGLAAARLDLIITGRTQKILAVVERLDADTHL